jgi:3-ketoacyl-CoA synthase
VFEVPEAWRVNQSQIMEILRCHECFDEEAMAFMQRMLERSGTGERTAWPPLTVRCVRPELAPVDPATGKPPEHPKPDSTMKSARMMADTVMFQCVDKVLKKTGVNPKAIDFLIVNCSLFCPTPSLCASVVRQFDLRSTCRTYNLGGMGCSAGLISVDLARQLLQNSPNSLALIGSLEDITQQLYRGKDRSMLLQNILFRVGGAAILLSNKPMDGFRAKYKLLHSVRVQDHSDAAWSCVFQKEDDQGLRGIELTKELTTIAGKALKHNLTLMGPRVLPLSEQAKVVVSIVTKKLAAMTNGLADSLGVKAIPGTASGRFGKVELYVPDFKKGVQHFCIHAGGRAVIDGIEQNLKLAQHHVAPSRATLRNQGNTSSSSVWYELKYVEQDGPEWTELVLKEGGGRPIRAGERVLQIAFGAGFKCNSAVWLRLK